MNKDFIDPDEFDELGQMEKADGDNKRKIMIGAAVGLLLLCCCCSFFLIAWTFGDSVVQALGM